MFQADEAACAPGAGQVGTHRVGLHRHAFQISIYVTNTARPPQTEVKLTCQQAL
jgi:hypothetical protein